MTLKSLCKLFLAIGLLVVLANIVTCPDRVPERIWLFQEGVR